MEDSITDNSNIWTAKPTTGNSMSSDNMSLEHGCGLSEVLNWGVSPPAGLGENHLSSWLYRPLPEDGHLVQMILRYWLCTYLLLSSSMFQGECRLGGCPAPVQTLHHPSTAGKDESPFLPSSSRNISAKYRPVAGRPPQLGFFHDSVTAGGTGITFTIILVWKVPTVIVTITQKPSLDTSACDQNQERHCVFHARFPLSSWCKQMDFNMDGGEATGTYLNSLYIYRKPFDQPLSHLET